MNKDIAQKWIDALRSGKYQQGRGFLHSNKGMCCLGVLCDLFDPKGWHEGEEVTSTSIPDTTLYYGYEAGQGSTSSHYLPGSVVSWAGLHNSFGVHVFAADKLTIDLANVNDQPDSTFAQIADLIEKNWEVL
jgi:hypothetical protein